MTLRNPEYRVTFSSDAGRLYRFFAKDETGWYQITSKANRHKATAEQVLNHVLPVLARAKPGVNIVADYFPDSAPPDS